MYYFVEKEESILIKNIKICLPAYKIIYSILFLIILALVRGISSVFEIGITMDPYVAILAVVFCADTYEIEYREKRWEIVQLRPLKSQIKMIYQRLFIQICYLSILSCIGYGFFYWQKPRNYVDVSSITLYGMFLVAVIVSIIYWSIFSMVLVTISNKLWLGIGISIVMWLILYSKMGETMLGDFNVFSFVFRDTENGGGWHWIVGKICALTIAIILLIAMPYIMRKEKR